jgi:hypothetical protein
MTELAIRFAQPEFAARDSIMTIGQAVRREVAGMSEGIERALSRAAELERLVHDEVTALERGQRENETRMRGVLLDFSQQREKIVKQTNQLNEASSAGSDYSARAVDESRDAITADARGNDPLA